MAVNVVFLYAVRGEAGSDRGNGRRVFEWEEPPGAFGWALISYVEQETGWWVFLGKADLLHSRSDLTPARSGISQCVMVTDTHAE